MLRFISILIAVFFFTHSSSKAAGLLALCSANASEANCPSGKLFFPVYKTTDGISTFNYRIDQGKLGDLSNDTTV